MIVEKGSFRDPAGKIYYKNDRVFRKLTTLGINRFLELEQSDIISKSIKRFDALKRLNYINVELLGNMMNAIESPNSRLAKPCGEVLEYFYTQRENKVLIKNYLNYTNLSPELMKKVKHYLN